MKVLKIKIKDNKRLILLTRYAAIRFLPFLFAEKNNCLSLQQAMSKPITLQQNFTNWKPAVYVASSAKLAIYDVPLKQ